MALLIPMPLQAPTLETLAVKAFGNMGQTARLRLIRDRFIAGHESCDLRRYLDCVLPDTPLRDIVDRCRVWESPGMSWYSWYEYASNEYASNEYASND